MQTELDYQWARPYLNADETVLWKGHPEKLHLFDRNDIFLIPFGLFWCGFAGYWEYEVLKAHAPLPFPLVGGLMMLFGLFFFFGRFLFKALALKKSSYVITDKCVLLKQGKEVKVLKKNDLPALSVRKHRDGTGTIALEPNSLFMRKPGYGLSVRYGMNTRGLTGLSSELHGIPEPERVLRLLQSDSEWQ